MLFLLLILLQISIFSVHANFNFNLNQDHLFGQWDQVGNDSTTLDGPNHVFGDKDFLIISDTGNGRIVELYKNNWTLHQIYEPIFDNGTYVNHIYETVVDSNNHYYSIIENNTIIKYNQTGIISEIIPIPNELPIMELDETFSRLELPKISLIHIVQNLRNTGHNLQ